MTAARRLVLFGDTIGLPRLLRQLDPALVAGLVRAEVRPEQEPELARLAAERHLPLLVQPRRTSDAFPAFVDAVCGLAPDLILVDSYSMLLPPSLLDLAPLGGVNVHGALLPRHRGANPIQWALLNDERSTGVTIHRMTEQIDAGAIVAQREVPMGFGDTWKAVYDRIADATEALLAEQLPAVLAGTATATPQPAGAGPGNRRRTREDGRFDWSWSVLRIYNLVRALVAPLARRLLRGRRTRGRARRVPHGLPGGGAEVQRPRGRRRAERGRPRVGTGSPTRARNDVIAVQGRSRRGPCVAGSLRVDWDGSRTAQTLLAVEADHAEVTARLIQRFAAAELELEASRVAHPGSGST